MEYISSAEYMSGYTFEAMDGARRAEQAASLQAKAMIDLERRVVELETLVDTLANIVIRGE